jgi:hypothetical protein
MTCGRMRLDFMRDVEIWKCSYLDFDTMMTDLYKTEKVPLSDV